MNLIKILFLLLTLFSLYGCGSEESSISTQVSKPQTPEVFGETELPDEDESFEVEEKKSFICVSETSLDEQVLNIGSNLVYGCLEQKFIPNNFNMSVFIDSCQEFFKQERVKIVSGLSCNDEVMEDVLSSPHVFTLGECLTDGDDLLLVKDVAKKYFYRGDNIDTFKKIRDKTDEFCQNMFNGLWLDQPFN